MRFGTEAETIEVNAPDRAALMAELERRMAAGEGFALATLNLDHLVKLRRDPAFRAAYAAQDLVTADGRPVVALSRLAGRRAELVTGSDSLEPICRIAARLDVGVAFVGSTPDALDAAAHALSRKIPGLRIVLRHAPSGAFDPEGDEAARILEALERSGAGLCILALGAPRQEIFAAAGRRRLPQMGFCCFGAGLDFWAGTQVRAPRWMRALALEWLWRAAGSPRRMVPRYAACAAILPALMAQALRQRRG